MSYTPTEWKTGDIVTAQKLNKIEAGISESGSGSGGSDWFVVNFTIPMENLEEQLVTGSTEVTPRQVLEAVQNNKNILLKATSSTTVTGTTIVIFFGVVPQISFQYTDDNFAGMMLGVIQAEIGAKLYIMFQGQDLDTPFEVEAKLITDNNSNNSDDSYDPNKN